MASNGSAMYDPSSNCTSLDNCNNNINCTLFGDNCSFPVATAGAEEVLDPAILAFQENSRFWVQRILVPLLMIIGVVGNTVTIFIMTQRRMRSSTNWYLAALAIFDMSYLVFSFLMSLRYYPHISEPQFFPYWSMLPYIWYMLDVASNTSVWITVTFTIERYVAVCHPIRGKVICTESRAKRMIVAVFVFCTAITLPTLFEWKAVELADPKRPNATYLKLVNTEFGRDDLYISIYSWLVTALFCFLPLLLLAVFNAFLVRSVHLSKSRRETMTRTREDSSHQRQESKITVMLIAVVLLFLVCQLPTAVTILYTAFHQVRPGSNEETLQRGLGNIFNFLVGVNAAGNFVLYCLLSQKYRRTFLLVFCPCLKDKIPRLKSVYHHTTYSTIEGERSRQQQLSFSKNVAVFTTDDCGGRRGEEEAGRPLLLRCPFWKQPKIRGTGAGEDGTTRQFIPLKSPSKCNNDIVSD